jgi:hypothetical protein
MSASTRSVPVQAGLGRFPSTLAALALVVILAVAVAIVALNGTKAAPVAGAKGAPPPAVIDHGWSNGETVILPQNISHFGGWGGPRTAPVYKGDNSKDDKYILSNPPYTGGAPHGLGLRPQ